MNIKNINVNQNYTQIGINGKPDMRICVLEKYREKGHDLINTIVVSGNDSNGLIQTFNAIECERYLVPEIIPEEEIITIKSEIDKMSHYDMAFKYYFPCLGDPVFSNKETNTYFIERFNKLGGLTPELRKQLNI